MVLFSLFFLTNLHVFFSCARVILRLKCLFFFSWKSGSSCWSTYQLLIKKEIVCLFIIIPLRHSQRNKKTHKTTTRLVMVKDLEQIECNKSNINYFWIVQQIEKVWQRKSTNWKYIQSDFRCCRRFLFLFLFSFRFTLCKLCIYIIIGSVH